VEDDPKREALAAADAAHAVARLTRLLLREAPLAHREDAAAALTEVHDLWERLQPRALLDEHELSRSSSRPM
jgi:hypothetical protein